MRRPAIDYLQYLALRLVLSCIQMISLDRCDRISRLLSCVFAYFLPFRKDLIDSNLRLVFPDWSSKDIDRRREEMWHHLFLMACEIAQSQRKIHRTNWREHYFIPERERFVQFVMDARPKIAVSGHFGNFELAGFVSGLFGIQNTTIARPLDNRFVHDYIMAFRSFGGQHFLPKNDSTGDIQKLLDRGGTLALLADQDAGSKGCWVNFLGHPASCHKALALFTLSSGAPMMVMTNRRRKPLHFQVDMIGVADPVLGGEHLAGVAELTKWYNDCLESMIRKYPEQYWWVHRRWREPPAKIRRQAAKQVSERAA